MTDYSDRAMDHAKDACRGRLLGGWSELRVGAQAMHDREALGLDASVCARTHLLEIVGALRGRLTDSALRDDTGDPHDEGYNAAQVEMHSWLDVLAREANEGQQ